MAKFSRNDSQCENLVEENFAPEPLTIDINDSRNIHVGVETILNEDVTLQQRVFLKNYNNMIEILDVKNLCPNCQLQLRNIKNEVIEKPKENVSLKWIQLALLVVFLVVIISIIFVAIFLLFKKSADHPYNLYYPQSNIMEDVFLEYPENEGMCFVQRSDWRAKLPNYFLSKMILPVERVIIAHSASMPCNNSEECKQSARNIQLFHMTGKRFFDIGYNFLVGGDGCVYIGRGWDYIGAHTLKYNTNSICITLIGTFTTIQPTEQQTNATIQLLNLGVKLGKLSKSYVLNGMCQVAETESPGKYLYDIISQWDSFRTSNTTPPCKYHEID